MPLTARIKSLNDLIFKPFFSLLSLTGTALIKKYDYSMKFKVAYVHNSKI